MEADDSIVRNLIKSAFKRKRNSNRHTPTKGIASGDLSRHRNTLERRKGQLNALRRDLDLYQQGDPIATERLRRGIKKSRDTFLDPNSAPHGDISWLMIEQELEERGIDPNVFLK